MKIVSLSGSPRANVGRKDANDLRRSGKVPCVLYGGKEQITFSAEEADFKNIIYTPEVCFVEIEVNGNKHKAVLQEAQFHKVSDKLIHADFLELHDNKPVVMEIPVKLSGTSEGVRAGGKLTLKERKLKLKALPAKMPDNVSIDITPMQIGSHIKVENLKIDGVEFLNPKNLTVVAVESTRKAAAAEEAAAPAKEAAKK